MTLMSRIKVRSFLTKTVSEQQEQIELLRALRTNSLEEARQARSTVTKSARKNLAKRGRKSKDPQAELLKLLERNPAEAARLAETLGLIT